MYNLRHKSTCSGSAEFHLDTGLSLMHDPLTSDEKSYRVVVDQPVLWGILDHAYSDPINEIIGHLGGRYDHQRHTAHVTHFSPSVRVIEELRPDSVEGQVTEQLVANERFGEAGVCYLGWYHSHPRIKPFPSFKDLQMQSEMQSQVPHSLGLICSSWWPAGVPARESSLQLTHYFSAFRIRNPTQGELEAVKVTWGVALQPYMLPSTQLSMSHTLEVLLQEAEDTHQWRKNATGKHLAATSLFVDLEYDGFLGRFLRDALTQHLRGLHQDLQGVAAYKTTQLQRLRQLQDEAVQLGLPGLKDFKMSEQSSPEQCPQVVHLLNRVEADQQPQPQDEELSDTDQPACVCVCLWAELMSR